MKIKKVLALILACVLSLSMLAGCTNDAPTQSEDTGTFPERQ